MWKIYKLQEDGTTGAALPFSSRALVSPGNYIVLDTSTLIRLASLWFPMLVIVQREIPLLSTSRLRVLHTASEPVTSVPRTRVRVNETAW